MDMQNKALYKIKNKIRNEVRNKTIDNYTNLIRLKNPIGYLLLFLPCSFGVALNYKNTHDIYFLALYFVGAIIMRSAGCAINDSLDKDIDKMVERTKNRPIANGSISKFWGYITFCILSLIGLFILIQLPQANHLNKTLDSIIVFVD